MTAWATYEIERRWAADLPDRHQQLLTERQVRNALAKLDDLDYMTTTVVFDRRRPNSGLGSYWEKQVWLSTRGTARWLVCHEWAHTRSPDGHGPGWLAEYAHAVDHLIGAKAATQLRLLLRGHITATRAARRRR